MSIQKVGIEANRRQPILWAYPTEISQGIHNVADNKRYYDRRLSALSNWLETFFDEETREFTLSCLRDLWRGLVLLICAVVFHCAVEILKILQFPEWATKSMEILDLCWCISAMAVTMLIFLGKLLWGRDVKWPLSSLGSTK